MQLRDRKKMKRPDGAPHPEAGLRLADLITLDRVKTQKSVKHLKPFDGKPSGYRGIPVPFPLPTINESKELQLLRQSEVWKKGTREDQLQQMIQWFPDMPRNDDVQMQEADCPSAPSRPPRARERECPTSNIGPYFSKLPGELRNRIYRLAVLQSPEEDANEPANFAMETGTCSQGACLHSKLNYNIPGIANTCRQMRWEALPIFCAEHKAFQFDDGMVQQNCVGNFLRTLGDYSDLIPEFRFVLKRPIWDNDEWTKWAFYTFTLSIPKPADSGDLEAVAEGWRLDQSEKEGRKVCQCDLDKLVVEMNKRVRAGNVLVGKEVENFVGSEEFADFEWRMRKSKQWPQFLKRCKACKEVIFNN